MGMLRILGIAAGAVAGAAGIAGAAAAVSSCAQTPANVPVRTFEQAKDVDYLCVRYNDNNGVALDPRANVGLKPNECQQVPVNVTGSSLSNHLLALVTQTTRGEVAVVDLTAGGIVDVSKATPGTNFIPVGASPTGIAVGADAQMTFVSSANPNKPAIYGIPTAARGNSRTGAGFVAGVFGDSAGTEPAPSPLAITDLPACALPQPPQTIAVAPISPQNGGPAPGYVLVAVLQRAHGQAAKVVAIDPTGMLLGGGASVGAGTDAGTGAGAGAGTDAGAVTPVTPGILAPCAILGGVALSEQLPPTSTGGPAWPDGVPYFDAGDLATQEPGPGPSCLAADAAPPPLATDPYAQSVPAHAAMRDDVPVLYLGDAELPIIHVFDLSNPAQPKELSPLLATSLAQPQRRVAVGAIAISPPTRNYQRYLYAVDTTDGSVMVFDVSDAASSPRTPLQRPHPELNPLAPVGSPRPSRRLQRRWASRLTTGPCIPNGQSNIDQVHTASGYLCNPNPNTRPEAGVFLDNGAYYQADPNLVTMPNASPTGTVQGLPLRLRGVFGFVTLTTGTVVTIDVDDWDAPCRRPDPMAADNICGATVPVGMTGLLAAPQPDAGAPGSSTFLDPYSAPCTELPPPAGRGTSAVTQEAFFPVSAPNRMRSGVLLRNDPIAGNHAPNIVGTPALTDMTGAPVSVSTAGGVPPLILPTALPSGFIDPTLVVNPTDPPYQQRSLVDAGTTTPNVRLSFDDPTASQDQAWSVSYEGALPTSTGIAADIKPGTGGGYETLTFTIGSGTGLPVADAGLPAQGLGPGFCERGVEDWDLGQARAQETLDAMSAAGLPQPPDLKQWTADYIEIQDELLLQGDAYWSVSSSTNSCWSGLVDGTTPLEDNGKGVSSSLADARYNACEQAFGESSAADTHLGRDLPILRAYDDHLDVGRFYWPPGQPEQTTNRVIVGQDPGNKTSLQFVACCFHQQASFKVRGGGEWIAAGQGGIGFLHHVIANPTPENDSLNGSAPGLRCVLSCDPNQVLLNARSFDVPWANIPWGKSGGSRRRGGRRRPGRRSVGRGLVHLPHRRGRRCDVDGRRPQQPPGDAQPLLLVRHVDGVRRARLRVRSHPHAARLHLAVPGAAEGSRRSSSPSPGARSSPSARSRRATSSRSDSSRSSTASRRGWSSSI